MKTPAHRLRIITGARSTIAALLLLSTLNPHLSTSAQAQGGSLTPPAGAPGPTMKTLDQVEARTPAVAGAPGVSILPSGTIVLAQSRSYYLTYNVGVSQAGAHGIHIQASNVTLDLNGFGIYSVGNAVLGNAIEIGANVNVHIRNGSIVSGSTYDYVTGVVTKLGFAFGINATGRPVSVKDLTIQGTRDTAIKLNAVTGALVSDCTVIVSGNGGIKAGSIRDCQADFCLGDAIHGRIVTNCDGLSIGTGGGVIADAIVANCNGVANGSSATWGVHGAYVVHNCHGYSPNGAGVSGISISNSYGESLASTGIDGETVVNSYGDSLDGNGLVAATATNSMGYYRGNAGTAKGMLIDGTASFCRGFANAGANSIQAPIAIGCTSINGPISSASKHLGTP